MKIWKLFDKSELRDQNDDWGLWSDLKHNWFLNHKHLNAIKTYKY